MKRLPANANAGSYMAEETALKAEHQSHMRAWEQTAPWYRRFSMRLGLEAKLILCFMAVLCAALGVTCVLFTRETHRMVGDIMGEQALQVATALSTTSEEAINRNDVQALQRRARELIKSRNILFVAFLDESATALTLASRDLDFGENDLTFDSHSLMQVSPRESATFGAYLQAVSPILSGSKLLGYVTVGVSQGREESHIRRVSYLVIGLACLMTIVALPIASLLVYRVFLPIRLLGAAARRFAAGDLSARAEIHRPDIIGDLARSFDEMLMRIKQQQEDLANANRLLAQANCDLEMRIEQRTAQLETANTRLSSEIAEKEDFLRAVSHDLNAPLRNISGMATMLLTKYREHFDEEAIYRIQRIKSNVEVETALINELLELSRIKTRRLKMEPVDVGALVEELRGVFESDLRSRAIELIVDTNLPMLNAERLRLRQLLQNLIDNAIKYMGDNAMREIHIGCQDRGDEAEFYVQDSGIGIDPEDLDKVFFVFRRGRNTIGQGITGKGVGLASVKSIVETYNGKIWVSSELGKGSTFHFTINGKFVLNPDGKAAA